MTKLRYFLFALFLMTFVLSGCAHDPALTKGQAKIDLSNDSVALLSVKISNQNKPSHQLEVEGTFICPESETCRTRPYWHKSNKIYRSEKNHFNEYLLSISLDPGTYNLHTLWTTYNIPLLVSAGALVPIDNKIEIKPNSIVYLGHLDVVLREKKHDKEECAALLPLIDAAIVGYSSGTFDVAVDDRFDEDMKKFVAEFPALQNAKVEKSILPQWIRPEDRPKN